MKFFSVGQERETREICFATVSHEEKVVIVEDMLQKNQSA